jgi:hypothetical protein
MFRSRSYRSVEAMTFALTDLVERLTTTPRGAKAAALEQYEVCTLLP